MDTENSPHERALEYLSPEDAYWELLGKGIEDPRGPYARRLVESVVRGGNTRWAYEVLYAAWLLMAKDPEKPQAPPVTLITNDEQQSLFRILASTQDCDLLCRALRTLYLPPVQREVLVQRLSFVGNRAWIQEAILDGNLSPDQKICLKRVLRKK